MGNIVAQKRPFRPAGEELGLDGDVHAGGAEVEALVARPRRLVSQGRLLAQPGGDRLGLKITNRIKYFTVAYHTRTSYIVHNIKHQVKIILSQVSISNKAYIIFIFADYIGISY